MGRFSKISQHAFEDMQLEAGMLLNRFNPALPDVQDEDIICATTGGITVTCTPTYTDFGEDVDNCPNNTKELKHLDSWDASIGTTALGMSQDAIKLSLGAADATAPTYELTSDSALVTGKTYYTRSGSAGNYTYSAVASPSASSLGSYYEKNESGKVTPRASLKQSDFINAIWWVGDRVDGGMVAVKLMNALSTGGFSLTTNKKAKGQLAITIGGHVSINDLDTVPMEFYSTEGESESAETTVTEP